MPRLSVWFIRSALGYLALGFTFGSLLLFTKGFPLYPAFWRWLPTHIEFVLVGWTVQLVLGMAFWILPRFPHSPIRGNVALAWGSFILVNAGIWLIIMASFGYGRGWLFITGRAAQAAGILAFGLHAWPRVSISRRT